MTLFDFINSELHRDHTTTHIEIKNSQVREIIFFVSFVLYFSTTFQIAISTRLWSTINCGVCGSSREAYVELWLVSSSRRPSARRHAHCYLCTRCFSVFQHLKLSQVRKLYANFLFFFVFFFSPQFSGVKKVIEALASNIHHKSGQSKRLLND
jgi:hypothetical protein